jgi:membrane-bound metal-dependent hydrolase YbcI (DUF457 family)
MASYRGHLVFASALGSVYAGVAVLRWGLDWGQAFLIAGLTTLGGLLPDLDSDSGVPVRELFGAAATVVPILLYHRLRDRFSVEQTLSILGGVYLFIRYVVSALFKRFTVHRGMFHSIPALLISGLATYLIYHNPEMELRWFMAGAVMIGFLSHLILDEIYSVDFMGARLRLNKYAGSALKLYSPSRAATAWTYAALAVLIFAVWWDWRQAQPVIEGAQQQQTAGSIR